MYTIDDFTMDSDQDRIKSMVYKILLLEKDNFKTNSRQPVDMIDRIESIIKNEAGKMRL